MRQYLIGASMIAATAVIIYAGSARAEPPPSMWEGSFRQAMVVCHTSDQIKRLVEAQKISDEKAVAVKQSLGDQCAVAYVHNVVVGDSEDLGIVETPDKTHEHLYVMHFGTARGDWFALYEEKADDGTPA